VEAVRAAIGRFERRVRRVELFVDDVNGPRGGVDQQCRCVVYLKRMAPIVATARESRLASAVSQAAERAAAALTARVGRRRWQPVRRPAEES
jgi:hypothetical protein